MGFAPAIVCFAVTMPLFFFCWLAEEMMEGDTHSFDSAIMLALRKPDNLADPIGPRWLEKAFLDITTLGSGTVLTFLTLAVAGYLAVKKRYYDIVFLTISVGGGALLGNLLKLGFGRPRPEMVAHLVKVSSLSFPSSHAMAAAITYISIGVLFTRQQPNSVRAYIYAISIVIAISVGISRVYLGVHWPTDVLASWSVGTVWIILCWLFSNWLRLRQTLQKAATPLKQPPNPP